MEHPKLPPSGVGKSSVFEDMTAIFADLSASSSTGCSPAKVSSISPSVRRRAHTPVLFAAAATLAAAAFASGIMLGASRHRSSERAAAMPVPQLVPVGTQAVRAAPTIAAQVEELGRSPKPVVALDRPKTPPKLVVLPRVQHRTIVPRRVRQAQPNSAHRAKSCEGAVGDDRARCMYPEILDADEALRSAYADAVNAGVNGRALSSLRNSWARLRQRARIDPDQVTYGYRQLERELRDLRLNRVDADEPRIADGF